MLTFQLPTASSEEIQMGLNTEGTQELITILSSFIDNDKADHYHLMLGNELTNEVSSEPDLAKAVTVRFVV